MPQPFFDSLQPKFHGTAGCHLGEWWQGVAPDAGGWRRALVTLPSTMLCSSATFEPRAGAPLEVSPPSKSKSLAAVRAVLRRNGRIDLGGLLRVHAQIPEGRGMGSSTSEILASTRAACAAIGIASDRKLETAILLEVDGAVDPIFLGPRAVLFAHREGRVLRDFGPLPLMRLAVLDLDPSAPGVDTATFQAPTYDAEEREEHVRTLHVLAQAISSSDLSLLGAAATASARINQRYLPKPRYEETLKLALSLGATGLAVAHTGTVAVAVFPNEARRRAIETLALEVEGQGGAWIGEDRRSRRLDRRPFDGGPEASTTTTSNPADGRRRITTSSIRDLSTAIVRSSAPQPRSDIA